MEIGRKLFYDGNGKILKDTGERNGYVIETDHLTDFPEYDPSIHEVIELSYGERAEEIINRGGYEIINGELVIYPQVAIQSDKETILNDGTDNAIITAIVPEDITLVFTVFDTDYSVDTVDGIGSLEVTTTALGEIVVNVDADKFGVNSVMIKGVDTLA